MPAILSHASAYPPNKWGLILKPLIPSRNQLWLEMTEAYELSMDARQLQSSANIKDTISRANLQLFRPEAWEELEKKASVPKRMGFEEESDIVYTFLNKDRYTVGRTEVLKDRLQPIVEDQVLVLEEGP